MSKPIGQFLEHCIPEEHRWKVNLFAQWSTIIGPLQERVAIQKIDGEILYLSVHHPAWAQEVALLAPRIKRAINRLFDTPKVTHIRFCADAPPAQPRLRIPSKDNSELQHIIGATTVPLTSREHAVLADINNQGLTDALAHYLNRCKTLQRRMHGE